MMRASLDEIMLASYVNPDNSMEAETIRHIANSWARECVKEFPLWMQDEEWVKSQSRPSYYCAKDGVELEYISFDQLFEKFMQKHT